MANSTWSGPVRSENGFQSITKNATTGAITTSFNVNSTGFVAAPSNIMAVEAGAGMSATSVYKTSVTSEGGIITTKIMIDLTGVTSSGTANDIIGVDNSSPAYIGSLTTANNGTIFSARLLTLETPATGDTDIDIYEADEATGAYSTAIGSLTETSLLNSGGVAAGDIDILTTPTVGKYLYMVQGGTTVGVYTAGKFILEVLGATA
jgi:hypothetical protein